MKTTKKFPYELSTIIKKNCNLFVEFFLDIIRYFADYRAVIYIVGCNDAQFILESNITAILIMVSKNVG